MKDKKLIVLSLFYFLLTPAAFSQTYAKYTSPKVYVGGQALPNPWAGGLNSPSYSTIDFNNDGINDLFVFDKQSGALYPTSYKIRTFLNIGTANKVEYVYAPQYERIFPQNMHDWVLLVDYDCDGHEDLFTYSYSGGMAVYHNDFTPGNGNAFTLAYPLLYSMYLGSTFANLYVSNVNQPILIDVNGDGDLDVLTFTILGGSIEYHENMAQEIYGRCDTLVFQEMFQCYAHVALSALSNTALLNACFNRMPTESEDRTRHNGSCMIGFDQNGDGDIDIINGDILGNNLLYMHNGKVPSGYDSITSFDDQFPVYNVPVNYTSFPAPYLFDADNDGKKDLIVSSCTELQSENYNNNLFYKNIGSNTNYQFQFVKNRFLTDEMVDVGCGSNVTFFDVDGDGKKDLLIGNYGYFVNDTTGPHQESAIAYYHNITSGALPEFEFMTDDFANLRSLHLLNLNPTFGDLNGDGFDDMIIGQSDGTVLYYVNNGTFPAQFTLASGGFQFQSIDVGTNSAPQLVDVNNDGLLDLLIGETYGYIYYYRNIGTASTPVFSYVTDKFGNLTVQNAAYSYYGFSNPLLYIENGVHKLLVSNENGYIFKYDNIDGNLTGTFNLVTTNAFGVYEPYRATFDMADLNNDGVPEVIVGNFAGGLSMYSTSLPLSVNEIFPDKSTVAVYPIPATQNLTFEFKNDAKHQGTYQLYDVMGKKVLEGVFNTYKKTISIDHLTNGIYSLQLIENNSTQTVKVMIH